MNFILIICDALRYDRVSEKYMSGLTELSKQGTNFKFCLIGGGNTLQSTPYILCSKKNYDEDENLAKILKSKGYSTAMIHSNLLLNKFTSGFDLEVDVYLKTAPHAREKKATRKFMRKIGIWKKTREIRKAIQKVRGKEKWEIPYRRAENILNEVTTYLNSASDPWFIWIQLMDPHIPYYPLNYESYTTWERVEKLNRLLIDSIDKQTKLTEKENAEIENLYNEEIRYMDIHLSKFIKEQINKAVIVVTSDHGDEFGEYGFYSHCPGKHGLIPQLIHVPLIFLGEKIKSQVIESYTSSLDIAPTILGLAGIDRKLGYGRNLKELICE
jgi:arylsulfatase A-like enzyme